MNKIGEVKRFERGNRAVEDLVIYYVKDMIRRGGRYIPRRRGQQGSSETADWQVDGQATWLPPKNRCMFGRWQSFQ